MSKSIANRLEQADRDRKAKEDVAIVAELGATLPPEVVQNIYNEVVLELALKAGFVPRKPLKEPE